jgi:hypothetical protein
MLWPIVKVDNDFGVAVRQETVDRVLGVIAFVINEVIDKLSERGMGNMRLKNHCETRSSTPAGLTDRTDIIVGIRAREVIPKMIAEYLDWKLRRSTRLKRIAALFIEVNSLVTDRCRSM